MKTEQSRQSHARPPAPLGIAYLSLTLSLIALLGPAVVVNTADRLLAAESISGPATVSPIIKGEVLMIAGETWVVRDGTGKGVLLQIGKATKVEGTVVVGDKVEVQASPDGQALSIKKVSK